MLNPYLFYQDTCEAAFNHYAKVLGGKIEMMMRASEGPADMQPSPGREKMIMHARMSLPGGNVLMASDAPPDHYHKPQGFAVSITVADPAEGERKFNALADGGTVTMPFAKTFWAKGFGMCVDKFGIPWMVNCPAEGM
ncbi:MULTISPECIES: VOC family protein [unclassified Bradyrhizobium]|uniref:VOC family protein n=1 Tax=unclassified Bradyrhizobium TaxID=2631580 RepID=UPI0020B2B6F1|nr:MULTISPECIES: VOC family protein [unclassified Bradyrhizobium]MCP3385708.1 VOC family protein [Bradyrhizobium sp. CCGUVB4N]MCP3446976.1 VOC family protein [Bradyrhizobium sp. CCGUVB14]WFU82821.1 VOC family protein [Bradyrhizobium sp. CIAT3101]